MKQKLLLLIVCCFAYITNAQVSKNYKTLSKEGNANYYSIVNAARTEFNAMDLNDPGVKKQKKQFERWALYWKSRVGLDGVFPSELQGYYNAGVLNENGKIVSKISLNKQNRSSNQTWINVGPVQSDIDNNGYPNFPQMGRLTSFLRIKHPTNMAQDVLFVGAPVGGVWKSTDGGTTWAPKLDMVAGIGVTDIKTSPTTTFANYMTQPIYVSTGDYDGGQVRSIGVLKSTDGGETFNSTGLTHTIANQQSFGDLVVLDNNTLFVGTRDFIQKSVDGGATFTNPFSPGFGNLAFGRAANTGNEIMYSDQFLGLYYTSDYTNDSNWTIVRGPSAGGKFAITIGEDNEFYTQHSVSGQIEKFDKTNMTFSNIGSAPPTYSSQDGFNQTLIVTNDLIISGDINGHISSDNGANWDRSINGYFDPAQGPGPASGAFDLTNQGVYVHSDHHRMGMLDDNLSFYSLNDGGLNYITFPSATSTSPTTEYKSGVVKVLQSYSVAINPMLDDGAYLSGNQDNDGLSRIGGQWYAVALGDGIQSAINYNTPGIRYAGTQNGTIVQTTTGFQGELNGNGNSVQIPGANFFFPLEMDKTDPNTIYGGGNDVYILDASTGLTISAANSGLSGTVSAIATHGDSVLATAGNTIRFSSDKGVNWSAVNAPSTGTLTSVDYDATNNNIIYASYGGYQTNKVFKTTNGGTSWTNITSNLPNVVVKEVLLRQAQSTELLFVATELGVYSTTNGGTSWERIGQGLPMVDVRDIDIHYTKDVLVAATFGRGLWELPISNATLSTDDFDNTNFNVTAYPNPANDVVNVTLDNDDLDYVIYNVVGGIIKKGTLTNNNSSIDVSDIARNLYILRVSNDKFSKSIKIILK